MRTRLLIAGCILLMVSQVHANGNVADAHVTGVRVDESGQGIVSFDKAIVGTPPSCVHPTYANALAFNTNTAAGRSILALALTAKATGYSLDVYGNGSCSIYGGSWVEDWSYGNAT